VKERRHDRRFVTDFKPEVRRADNDTLLGNMVDASAGGMMISCDRPVRVGESLTVHVEMPRSAGPGANLTLQVEIRWCEQDMIPGLYLAGLEFMDTEEGSFQALNRLRQLLGSPA
jgi:hypothetical protein